MATKRKLAGEVARCGWVANGDELYIQYHDDEWGVPVHDDRRHFEFLTLESAQAGLSWATVLRKREGYRKAFADFDPGRVAGFTDKRIEKLCGNPEIVRNRLKIKAAVSNAKVFLAIQEEFGSFDAYAWQFVDGEPIQNSWTAMKQIPVTSDQSDAFSKDMKKRGIKFFGSTICYAHMQAIGMVNDHEVSCFRYSQLR